MPPKDYYSILGVSEKASNAQIRNAYRRLAKSCHPDTHPGDNIAEEKFKQISEAYGTLGDPERRRKYDQLRKLGARSFEWTDLRGGPKWARAKAEGFSVDDLGPFGDLFSELFDRSGRYQRPASGPISGANLGSTVQIPFKTSISGGQVTVAFSRAELCNPCSGSGAAPGTGTRTCPDCDGRGTVAFAKGAFALSRPCPRCFGRGTIIETPCPECSGTGEVQTHRTLNVTIPAGIPDRGRIRLQGQGQSGSHGGPPGDLILNVRVGSDPFFRRRGDDIYCEVPISFVEAALGTKVRVRTVHRGKRAMLRIPPGTQAGTMFRLAGMGVNRNGRKGSQFVTVKVLTPTDLSDREQKILQEFAQERRQGKHRK